MKTILQWLLVLLISALLAEVSLRVFHHYYPTFVFESEGSGYARFRGKPYAHDYRGFRLNSLGFKDTEFAQPKGDAYRVVALGDSFGFAVVPYPQAYLTLLEKNLVDAGRDVEIFNFGIPGIGPMQYFSLLGKEGISYQPDLVLVSFFVGNDFMASARDRSESRKGRYSYLYEFFNYLFNIRPQLGTKVFHGRAKYCDHCPTMKDERYIQIELERSLIYRPFGLKAKEQFESQMADSVYYLEQIQRLCERWGCRLAVLLMPDVMQIDPALAAVVREASGVGDREPAWELDLPNRRLGSALAKLGIPYLDLLDHFLAKGNAPRLYKPNGTHWNIAGNRLAADTMRPWLESLMDGTDRSARAPSATP